MKTHASTLMRSVLLLGLLLVVGTTGVVQARAAGPLPQPTPTGIPTPVSPPPPGMAADMGAVWYDGIIKWSTILNCFSIINNDPYYEYGAGTSVGYYANHAAGQPTPNTVYYVHVIVEAVGNACSGQNGYIDIGLPPNTSLAISATHPVYCYANGVRDIPDCPQTLPASGYNVGWYDIRAPASNYYTWPLPEGYPWEFQIPVISTTTLSGSNFQAAVWVLDGNDSPWLYPTEGIYVFAPPAPGAFSKSTPANLATKQSSSPTLKWAASSGASSYAYCIDTSNNNACNTSWVSTGTATSKALSGLAHGVHYYWQVRAKNAGGTTYANGGSTVWWSFTTLPLPGTFNKSAPANAATKQSSSPTLKWAASSNATSYQYCIDTSNNNTCNASWVSTGTATSKVLSGLAHGVHYYWQVRAKNAAGYKYANGASTAWWSFTTLPLPGAFNKSAPANAATNQATSPTLKWAASSNATSYQYCIDTSNNNTCNASWISVGTATSKVLSGLAHGAHYYWQVRAKNAAGYKYANDASTAWWSFTVH